MGNEQAFVNAERNWYAEGGFGAGGILLIRGGGHSPDTKNPSSWGTQLIKICTDRLCKLNRQNI